MHSILLRTFIFLVLIFALTTFPAYAKRSEPTQIRPITIGDVTYELETSKTTNKLGAKIWSCNLIARKMEKILWREIVYSYSLDQSKEIDVQEIYPTKFSVERSKIPLLDNKSIYPPKWFNIETEDGKYFRVNAR